MAKLLRIDLDLFEAMQHAPSDPEAAARALTAIAVHLRRLAEWKEGDHVSLPEDAARYLADALERTARVPAKARPAELARALNLTSAGRRPKVPELELAFAVHEQLGGVNAAIAAAAERFDVDISTVRRAWRKWQEAFEESRGIE